MTQAKDPDTFFNQLLQVDSVEAADMLIAENLEYLSREFIQRIFVAAEDLVNEMPEPVRAMLNVLTYAVEKSGNPLLQGDMLVHRARWERQQFQTERSAWLYVAAAEAYRLLPDQTTVEIAVSLSNAGLAFFQQGDFQQAVLFLNQAIEHDLATNQPERAIKALHLRGRISHIQGDFANAQTCFQQALSLAMQNECEEDVLSQLNNLGILQMEQGELEAAESSYRQVLIRSQSSDYVLGVAMATGNLGIIALERSSLDEAEHFFKEAETLYKKLNNQEAQASNLGNLGMVAGRRGHHLQALDYYKQALALMHQVHNLSGVILYLNNLGDSTLRLGNLSDAQSYYQQAFTQAQQIGSLSGQAQALAGLGSVAQEQGKFAQAETHFDKALFCYEQIGDVEGTIKVVRDQAGLALSRGETVIAFELLEQAKTKAFSQMPNQYAATLVDLGNVYQIMGDFRAAQTVYEQALTIYRQQNSQQQIATILHNLAGVYYRSGDIALAASYLEEASIIHEPLGSPKDIASTLLNRSQLLRVIGHLDDALIAAQQGLDFAQQSGNVELIVNAMTHLTAIQSDLGEFALAVELLRKTQALTEKLENPGLRGTLLLSLGLLAENMAKSGEAIRLTIQGIRLCQQAGYLPGQANGWRNLGTIYMTLGDLTTAEESMDHALALCEQMGDRRGTADNLGNLAGIAYERGEWAYSAKLHQQALDLYATLGYRRGQAYELCNLAYLVEERGETEEAATLFHKALMICRDAGFRQGEVIALTGLGTAAHKERRDQEAINFYQLALEMAQTMELHDMIRVLCTNLGFLAELANELGEAESWYAAATETIERGRHNLLDEKLRIVYLARRLDPFSRLVLVSWHRNRKIESFQWCETSRSRTFLELLNKHVYLVPATEEENHEDNSVSSDVREKPDSSPMIYPELVSLLEM